MPAVGQVGLSTNEHECSSSLRPRQLADHGRKWHHARVSKSPAEVDMNERAQIAAVLVGTALLLAAGSGLAHHSPAMFDATKKITLTGTVKEFQWMSPHCWIQVLVPNAAEPSAAPVEWGVEMDNPLGLSRHGWKPGSLKAGDEIVVVAHPLRDGSHGAQVVSVTRPDGTPVGDPLVKPQ